MLLSLMFDPSMDKFDFFFLKQHHSSIMSFQTILKETFKWSWTITYFIIYMTLKLNQKILIIRDNILVIKEYAFLFDKPSSSLSMINWKPVVVKECICIISGEKLINNCEKPLLRNKKCKCSLLILPLRKLSYTFFNNHTWWVCTILTTWTIYVQSYNSSYKRMIIIFHHKVWTQQCLCIQTLY